jgi:hypothetical protein
MEIPSIIRWAVLAIALGACGPVAPPFPHPDGGPPADAGADPDTSGIPLVLHAVFRYWVVDPTTATSDLESHTTEAIEDVGSGRMAYRIRKTRLKGGTSMEYMQKFGALTVYYRDSNLAGDGSLIRQDDYTPYRVRFDGSAQHTATGAQWSETYAQVEMSPTGGTVQSNQTAMWDVLGGDETVTITGTGTITPEHTTYAHCVKVQRTVGNSTKTYWFARGIGKVKESGGQEEQLVSYSIP